MTLWLIARSLGFVALSAFTASVVLGLTSSSIGSPRSRYVQQLVHRSLAAIALVALSGHFVSLVLDSYVDVPWSTALVPFTSGYEPLAVTLGTLAVWSFLVTAVSGMARGRLAGTTVSPRVWRWLHRSAWAGWVLSVGHGLLAGTDSSTTWAVVTYAVCVSAVAGAALVRCAVRPGRLRAKLTDPDPVAPASAVPVRRFVTEGASS